MEFLRENWVPILVLLVMVLGVFVLLVDQTRREAQWRQNKRRRAMSEWASREGGVVIPAVVGVTAGAGKCCVCGKPVAWQQIHVCLDKDGNRLGIQKKFYCSDHVPL